MLRKMDNSNSKPVTNFTELFYAIFDSIKKFYVYLAGFIKIVMEFAAVSGSTYLGVVINRNRVNLEKIHGTCKGNWIETFAYVATYIDNVFVYASVGLYFFAVFFVGYFCLAYIFLTKSKFPKTWYPRDTGLLDRRNTV
jgi:hypothetical protein